METQKKKKLTSGLALVIVLVFMLISMVGTNLVSNGAGKVKVTTYTEPLSELAAQVKTNAEATGRTVDILFEGNDSAQICFSVYKPANATAETPAPCVVCAHGWNNSKEMQYSNFTELARRGFVVIALDLAGHGRSDVAVDGYTKGTEGLLAVVEYAMSLDFVDINKVGLTGHSAGDLDCSNTLKLINVEGSNNHISSWFCSSGTIGALFLTPEYTQNLIWGVSAGKCDELDTVYFSASHFLDTPIAVSLIQRMYPAFAETVVPEGQWYGPDGEIAAPADGQALGVTSAFAIWNPGYTHPQGVFHTEATKLSIDFFYDAYGTPAGSTYIPSDNQIWTLGVVFQTIGLIAFFALSLILVSLLLKTSLFKSLKRTAPAQESLPSIKSWKEWVPLVLTFVPLMLFPIFTYFKCYNAGSKLFDSASYGCPTVNGIAWWTLCAGLFYIVMLGVNSLLRKLFHKNDGLAESSFLPGKLDGIGHFLKTLGFAAVVVMLTYIPCYIAYYVFGMNFGIAVYVVGAPRAIWLPDILLKYLPIWILFMVPNAILNANTRFKEIPEWASTLFVVIANLLPIGILTWVNYAALVNNGLLMFPYGDPSIMAFNLFAPMIFIGISSRYIYKKTGNAWAAGLINAAIIATMALAITRHSIDFMFHF